MPTSSSAGGARWVPRPVRAALLRAAAVVIPVLAAVAAGALTSAALPPARDLGDVVLAWCAVLAASTVTAVLVERLTRRLLPLATLLKLSMLFPDKAPSRYKVARKVAGTSALAAELERARKAGVHGDRQEAAETILALVGMLGDYDSRTRGHSERTQLFVSMLADELKLRAEDRDKLVWAALVHDIGKLRVPTEVLNKPGKPDDEEWRQLKAHPATGATICSPLQEWLGPWWLAIEQHHERFDGLGYPAGVAGQEISLGARIVSVADSYEVMTAARPYKRPMSATAAREELARCAGSQFDPVVVRAFLNISLGRLRWAAGPLSWIAQLPMLQPISSLGPYVAPLVGKVAGVAAGAATAGAALLGLGLGPTAADAAEPTASAPRQEQVEQDERPAPAPTTVPPTTSAPVPSPTAEPPTPTTAPSATAPAPVRQVPSASTPSPTPAPTPGTPPTSPTTPPAPPANRAPVAADDTTVTGEDAPVEVDLLANDTDPDGDALTATLGSVPAHGAATLTDGLLTYAPDGDWSGVDALTYTATDPGGLTSTATVTLTVTPVNDAPTAADDATTTPEDTPVEVDLLANDTDPDGDTLTATITTGPTSGTATLADGLLTYTPDGDRNGTDTLTYTATDPDGLTSTASVTVTVTAVNDAPTAADDAGTTPEDTPVQVDLLANDTDPDGDTLTATITTGPTSGTATLTDGLLTYTPDGDRNGTDTLTYTATDPDGLTSTATVTLTVTPVNDAPTAADDATTTPEDTPVQVDLLANDTDPDGDTLTATITTGPTSGTATLTDGLLTYTPDGDRNGTDTLTYAVHDADGESSTATLTLTVTPVNDAPTAADDAGTTAEDTPVQVDLLANDTDPDGDTLTATITTGPTSGTATLADGLLTYTPDGDRNGTDTLTYTATDPDGLTSTATVILTVTPVNDAPTAADDATTTAEDTPVQVDLLANDTDPDGDTLTATITTGPTSGTATLTDGLLTYTPDGDRNGTDTLTYTATDPDGLTSTATVTLTVTPVNDAPTAADDATTTPEDTPVQVDLLANDTDPDGDTLTATITTGPTSGTATLTDGLLTYTPDGDRNGTDTLTYAVHDADGESSTATLTLTVTPVNDAPTAADDEYTVVAGVALSGSLLDNDGDEDGDPLTVVGDTSDDFDVAADGTFTWTFGSPGVRQFAYTVSDGATTSTADVTITVTAAPPTQRLLYLHGSPHGTRGALSPTAPVASGDWDSDGQPGLTILKGGQDDDEDEVDRFHEWQYTVPAGGVTLDGPVQLQLSSRTAKLDLDGAHVDYTIWLYDCSASGGGCVQLAKADDVHVDRWSPGLGWEQRTLQIGSVHQTVPQGRVLRLRFAVEHSDVWLALDGDHPSTLTWSSTTP